MIPCPRPARLPVRRSSSGVCFSRVLTGASRHSAHPSAPHSISLFLYVYFCCRRGNAFQQAAISHYHTEIDGLLGAGIIPMVTLLHFTHPLWLEDMGGFESDESPAAFLAFARRMYAEYGGKVSRPLQHRE